MAKSVSFIFDIAGISKVEAKSKLSASMQNRGPLLTFPRAGSTCHQGGGYRYRNHGRERGVGPPSLEGGHPLNMYTQTTETQAGVRNV